MLCQDFFVGWVCFFVVAEKTRVVAFGPGIKFKSLKNKYKNLANKDKIVLF